MRAVVQRVLRAGVQVESTVVGWIARGLLVYVGVAEADSSSDARKLAEKIAGLRIFEDEAGKLNLSVRGIGGGVLVVPNFTLMADARKGRRPAFTSAAAAKKAQPLFEAFAEALEKLGCHVAAGRFGAHMTIHSDADGPVNIILDVPGDRNRADAQGAGT